MRLANQIALPLVSSPSCRLLTTGLFLLGVGWSVHGQFYAVTDLGTLGGTNGMAYGINNHEQVVGTAQTAMGNYHAFMFDGGRMADLGTLGGSNSWAHGINDMGWLVGAAEMPMTNMHGFLCTNALMNPMMMDLGTLGGSNSAAWMIDMYGDLVGWAGMANGSHHGFFMTNWLTSDMMDMSTVGGTNSELYCISSNRMAAGYAMMSSGTMQPIISTNAMFGSSSMMGMGMGGMGASGGQFWSINNTGNTAGMAQMAGGNYHAVVSASGGMMGGRMNVDLGTLGGTNSIAYCLTDPGTIVGAAQIANGMMHAFMVTNALGSTIRMMDLNTLIPMNSGWELMEARGVNTAGQIIGWGMHGGHTNAFLLTPVSGPTLVTSAPSSEIVGPGGMVTLQMQMNASEPLNYQWLHDGMPIPGATNSTLPLSGMGMANAGQYTVIARNGVGTVARSSATVGIFGMGMSNQTPVLTIAAPAGTHFRIDYSDGLLPSPNWQTGTNLTMMSSLTQIGVTPGPSSHGGFYRAVLMP
jgi:probable HAF family extracellular repeat protein